MSDYAPLPEESAEVRAAPLPDGLLQRTSSRQGGVAAAAGHAGGAETDSWTLHVGGLLGFSELEQEGTYCTELGQFFAQFGRVLTVDVRVADEERRSEGKTSWALVTFETADAAQAALEGAATAAAKEGEEGGGLGEEIVVRHFDKKIAAGSTGSMRQKNAHHRKRQQSAVARTLGAVALVRTTTCQPPLVCLSPRGGSYACV